MIPRDLLRKIGVGTSGSRRFKLANGKVEEYEVGEARVEVEKIVATSLIVFGPENTAPLLGVTTLELLGLQVDPLSGAVKPMDLYLQRRQLLTQANSSSNPLNRTKDTA
jgi:predicted aspartyl protease